jgi:F-type H+-transporting ATPase subunit delta
VDGYQDELSAVTQVYEAEDGLRAFLFNPRNSAPAIKAMLTNVLGETVRPNILNFMLLLLDKGRMPLLPEIYREYVKRADEAQGILNITIMTAMPLDQQQMDKISETFRTIFHSASVKTSVQTDPSLLGGVKVRVGDKLYDGTLQGKLSRLQSVLAGRQDGQI